MKDFFWDSSYNVGVKKFDDQHKHLIEALKDINKAMEDKRDKLAIAQVINNLKKYAQEHLIEEENFLLDIGYPDYESHKQQHEIFKDKLAKFCDDFNSDRYLLHFEIAVFLKNWILNHIKVVDKKYADFLNEKSGP